MDLLVLKVFVFDVYIQFIFHFVLLTLNCTNLGALNGLATFEVRSKCAKIDMLLLFHKNLIGMALAE